MSISVGSGSVKPYVGGTEIKEAYVGSELVYQSKLPYVYYFLGTENDYVLSNDCKLTARSSISKASGESVYTIACTYDLTNDKYGVVTLTNIGEYAGKILNFLYKPRNLGTQTSEGKAELRFYSGATGSGSIVKRDYFYPKGSQEDYLLYSIEIPAGANSMNFLAEEGSTTWSLRLDAIRIMLE